MQPARPVDERQFRSSSHREKVVEHVFLGELLRHLWVSGVSGVQVLKPEVDAAGYDLVLSLGTVIRHVQIKASMVGGKVSHQSWLRIFGHGYKWISGRS